jgi:cytochrome c oxidase subunit IV
MKAEHIDSVKTYVAILAFLLIATVVTTAVSFVDLGPFSVVVALTIAVSKMLLVALFFMHIRYSTRLTKLVIIGGLMWLGILLLLTLTDFVSRGCLDQEPGRPCLVGAGATSVRGESITASTARQGDGEARSSEEVQ